MNPLQKMKRSKQVAEILFKYGLDEIFERTNLEQWLPERVSQKLINEEMRGISVYERIRRAMEELGTTYVKLGQMLSDRRDLLPAELVSELQKLQDNVEVQQINVREKFQQELGINIDAHFETLACEPMASASIGQVFKGTLKNGQDVAVKIKREGIDDKIEADLSILNDLVGFIEKRNELFSNLQPKALLAAFEKSLREELSLEHERRNIERFGANFYANESIVVPQIYPHLCNNNILCMDFIYGTKVTNKENIARLGLQTKDVAILGLDLYMKQVFDYGFFHADPHPGNILLADEGKLAFIDLGAVGKLLPKEHELLGDILFFASLKNVKKMIGALKDLAVSYDVPDDKRLERDLGEIMAMLTETNLAGVDISAVMSRFTRILTENSIAMPEGVYMLAKGVAQIEGIGRYLYPELDIAAIITPYVKQMLKQRLSPKRVIMGGVERIADSYDSLLSLPEEVKNFLQKISNKEIRLEHEIHGLDDIRATLERVGIMLIIAALIIGASILSLNENLPQLFGISMLSVVCIVIALGLAIRLIFQRK